MKTGCVIQTNYNGHYFRSRLEARWAVFFDFLSIQYLYEFEGFDFGEDGRYLPDFYLPDFFIEREKADVWIEVKPKQLTINNPDRKKWQLVAKETHNPLIVLTQPASGPYEFIDQSNLSLSNDALVDWLKCCDCGAIKIGHGSFCPSCQLFYCSRVHPALRMAYEYSLSYRFLKNDDAREQFVSGLTVDEFMAGAIDGTVKEQS